jgi:hypothetical protein
MSLALTLSCPPVSILPCCCRLPLSVTFRPLTPLISPPLLSESPFTSSVLALISLVAQRFAAQAGVAQGGDFAAGGSDHVAAQGQG